MDATIEDSQSDISRAYKRRCVAAYWEGELWVMEWSDGTREAGRVVHEPLDPLPVAA
jgi:hypothetical protein